MNYEEIYMTRGYRGLHRVPPQPRPDWLYYLATVGWFFLWIVVGVIALAIVFLIPFVAALLIWGAEFYGSYR